MYIKKLRAFINDSKYGKRFGIQVFQVSLSSNHIDFYQKNYSDFGKIFFDKNCLKAL